MGYGPKCILAPFAATTAQTLVGNGYCVPVCAMAVAVVASVVGSVAQKKTSKTRTSLKRSASK